MNDNDAPLWGLVDAAWYGQFYPVVEALVGLEGCPTVKEVYTVFGEKLGHSPNPFFDEIWYLNRYKDVAEAVSGGATPSGFNHYSQFGHIDRAPHWLFDPDYYATQLEQSGFESVEGCPYTHFLETGQFNGLSGHFLFDPATPEAFSLYETTQLIQSAGPFIALVSTLGLIERELRSSALFDPDWYLATYPAVLGLIEDGEFTSALHHYLTNPDASAYDPSPLFSDAAYLTAHPDVSTAIETGAFRNGFEHYRRYGRQENRSFFPHQG